MKKILIILLSLTICCMIDRVLAFENNEFKNKTNTIIDAEQLDILKNNFNINLINEMDEYQVNLYTDLLDNSKSMSVYIITTYKMDKAGNIVDQYSMNATEEEAELVAKDNSLKVSSQNSLVSIKNEMYRTLNYTDNYYYETESKRVTGSSEKYGDTYVIQLWASWYKIPKIKQFDIMAVRWNNNVNISNIIGWQECDSNTGISNYNLNNKNVKYTSNGAGISMNIHDSAKNRIELYMRVESKDSFGYDFYGTYQHARNSKANTLAISQSYTFGDGLGGVLVFNNKTYESYYDNMMGIKYHFE